MLELPVHQVSGVEESYAIYNAARVAHEVNRAYCEAIGDTSQVPWEQAPQWQGESAVNGVIFHLSNPDATPKDSHNSWLAEKEAAGWKYGPVKDVEKKEHPCFRPYEELPLEQRVKDYLFRGVVHAMIVANRGGKEVIQNG